MAENEVGQAVFDEDGEEIITEDPPVKDAATMILVRHDSDVPRILMGQRSKGHVFMPNKYVFPGGRVDEEDALIEAIDEMDNHLEEKLQVKNPERTPSTFLLTAIRETFEETGLIVGKAVDQNTPIPDDLPSDWRSYYEQNVRPSLEGFVFIGRAITPPQRPRRFDARFFMANAHNVLADNRDAVDGAELSDLNWLSLEEAMQIDLPKVTEFMLEEVKLRLEAPNEDRPAPFLQWGVSGGVIDYI